jgi:hypothetical protein
MGLQIRSSVLAIMPEVTEGTAVVPNGATTFLAMQDDFAMEPSFETLENAELKSSIGKSKMILGAEAPTGSMSHYLKHSGTEGQSPQYNLLLKSAFGTETVESTQYNTVGSSTTTVIKVDTGEGAQFSRGHILLIKDATNGYSIRPVHSVSGDDLTLGFSVSNAPALGVDLGKACMFEPASSSHPSLTIWHYLANGGATQMMTGAKVTEVSINFTAGELINVSYSFEGLGFYFNPITITSSNKYIDFNDGGGQENASITTKTYKDPHALADAIESAMDALTADTITVTYSDSTGKFTLASTGGTFSLLWNTGTNTANTIGTTIGFTVAADDTGAATYTSDNAISFAAGYTPTFDSTDPLAAKNHVFFLGDQTDSVCFEPSVVDLTISNTRATQRSICAETGVSGSIFSEREVTMNVTALLGQYDVDKFRKYRENEDTRAFYAFGEKSGGNWVAGKCGAVYGASMTITNFVIGNEDGQATLELELKGYIDSSGNGEIYMGFV